MKAQVAVVAIGSLQFPGYQLETGEYGLSGRGLSLIVNKDETTVRRFLQSKQVKGLLSLGSTVRHNTTVIANGRGSMSITFIGTDISTEFILGQAMHGCVEAVAIVKSLMSVSLQERIKASFGGAAATLQEMQAAEAVIMSRELERKRTVDAHHLFCNAVELFGIPAALAHDYMTTLISGWTAKEARELGYLMPDSDPSIGLNYQEDPRLLRWIADAKVKFGTYRKGTWQERCERAVKDTQPT